MGNDAVCLRCGAYADDCACLPTPPVGQEAPPRAAAETPAREGCACDCHRAGMCVICGCRPPGVAPPTGTPEPAVPVELLRKMLSYVKCTSPDNWPPGWKMRKELLAELAALASQTTGGGR